MEREDRIEGILTHFERQYRFHALNSPVGRDLGVAYICYGEEKCC